jgi:AbrB family looped-hinge helix DNA binding protein
VGKVTSKLQITIPKAVADRLDIRPGDDLDWRVEGNAVRLEPGRVAPMTVEQRRAMFDEMIRRQRVRTRGAARTRPRKGRGWTREELYDRGRPR